MLINDPSLLLKALAAAGAASFAFGAWKRSPTSGAPTLPVGADDANNANDSLRDFVSSRLGTRSLVVVANREPYTHSFGDDGTVNVSSAAGGLLTALEPLLRLTGGTWVAHGSGTADRATVDRRDSLRVPPEAPAYTLKRVFLTPEEERNYYCGFANEGLWPLCHNAFTKPIFRAADWMAYREVNQRFATAAVGASDGVILLQDYHFALAARMIRDTDARQTIGSFWHIPWPAAEIFAICPWKEDLLDGLLALDLLAFHTRSYCLNFLDAVERILGCTVDRERMEVTYRGRVTRVRAIPISIDYPASKPSGNPSELRRELGIGRDVHVGVAVDRVDYTKGILERLQAVDRLFERDRGLIGKYTLVQIAAPCRGGVPAYRELEGEIERSVTALNARWGKGGWVPAHLIMRGVPRDEVMQFYRMADSALVTPLHDGMNLVAKEYAALCEHDQGALILSEFAGAAAELTGAVVVNPFDADAVAEAIRLVVHMPASERARRIAKMHAALRKNTIVDWARNIFTELTEERSGNSHVTRRKNVGARRSAAILAAARP